MPTLYRWFQQEYRRLRSVGKGELADSFEAYRRCFFDYDYRAVVNAIPELYRQCDSLDEPAIRLLVDYYRMIAEAYWVGNLAKGLDIATRSLVYAQQALGGNTTPELYARISLLYAWLDTDGPGYASQVLVALGEVPDDLPIDLGLRFDVLRAYALMRIEPDQALDEMLSILPQLGPDWPPPNRLALRADALLTAGRYQEALTDYQDARAGFLQIDHPIQATGMQISEGEALLSCEQPRGARETLEAALNSAERSLNRAQVGIAQGLLGRALAALGEVERGIEKLSDGLATLSGLGWLRVEAEFAVARLEATREADLGNENLRRLWLMDAQERVGRLRSTDLLEAAQDSGSD